MVVFESEMLRSPRPLAAGVKRLASRGLAITLPVGVAVALAVTAYALAAGRTLIALVGLGSGLAIAITMTLRTYTSLRKAQRSLALLNHVLAESKQERSNLRATNAKLERKNLELRMVQIAVAQGFTLVDERTQGRLREIVIQAGDDLAALVDESLGS